MYKPKVYTASKIWHAPKWRELRSLWPEVEFTSRWIFMEHLETGGEPTPADFSHFWTIDIQDVRRSDFVLLYREVDETLKGGLVEAGCALGLGKSVLAVGLDPSHSWANHPCVTSLDSLSQAREYLKLYSVGPHT